jgi:hypothetical protein
MGMAEQEQNGVSIPNKPANAFAGSKGIDLRRLRILNAGNQERKTAMINTIRTSSRDILRKVVIKNARDIEILSPPAKENTS